jgi:hypothetical protein
MREIILRGKRVKWSEMAKEVGISAAGRAKGVHREVR